MPRKRKVLIGITVAVVAASGWLYYALVRSPSAALRHAEAFLFRRTDSLVHLPERIEERTVFRLFLQLRFQRRQDAVDDDLRQYEIRFHARAHVVDVFGKVPRHVTHARKVILVVVDTLHANAVGHRQRGHKEAGKCIEWYAVQLEFPVANRILEDPFEQFGVDQTLSAQVTAIDVARTREKQLFCVEPARIVFRRYRWQAIVVVVHARLGCGEWTLRQYIVPKFRHYGVKLLLRRRSLCMGNRRP